MKKQEKLKSRKRLNLKIIPFAFYVNDRSNGWGFDILNLTVSETSYCLIRFALILPNAAERAGLMWRGDFLFLTNLLHRSRQSHWATISMTKNGLLLRLKRVLEKTNWKMRRHMFSFIPLTLGLGCPYNGYGIEVFEIGLPLMNASLLALYARPFKRAERTTISWHGDFLFLKHYLTKKTFAIGEEILWSPNVSKAKKVFYKLLMLIFN